MTQDKDQMRAEFEKVFSAPPYEFDMRRRPDDMRKTAWPGSYVKCEVECAWDGWQAARASANERTIDMQELIHELRLDRDIWKARASAPQGVPEGWALVPATATYEMLCAGNSAWANDPLKRSTTLYAAMIAAAPQQEKNKHG